MERAATTNGRGNLCDTERHFDLRLALHLMRCCWDGQCSMQSCAAAVIFLAVMCKPQKLFHFGASAFFESAIHKVLLFELDIFLFWAI